MFRNACLADFDRFWTQPRYLLLTRWRGNQSICTFWLRLPIPFAMSISLTFLHLLISYRGATGPFINPKTSSITLLRHAASTLLSLLLSLSQLLPTINTARCLISITYYLLREQEETLFSISLSYLSCQFIPIGILPTQSIPKPLVSYRATTFLRPPLLISQSTR